MYVQFNSLVNMVNIPLGFSFLRDWNHTTLAVSLSDVSDIFPSTSSLPVLTRAEPVRAAAERGPLGQGVWAAPGPDPQEGSRE